MVICIEFLFRTLFFHLECYKEDFYKRNYTFCGITSYIIYCVSKKHSTFFRNNVDVDCL